MGRKKIAIEPIEDLNKRYVAFSKRKDGLFKKAETACRMYGSTIGIFVFSPTAGKLHTFGPVDSLIDQFLHQSSSPHLNSSTTTTTTTTTTPTTEGNKRSRSEDDDEQVLMMMEERETKKRKLLMMSTTTTTTTTTTEEATTTEEEEEEEEEEEKEGFLLMDNDEFMMDLEKNVIDQLRTTEELLARLQQDRSYIEEAANPTASELDDDDDELKEYLNGVADEIITGHHHLYEEKNWATIDDWDQLLIS